MGMNAGGEVGATFGALAAGPELESEFEEGDHFDEGGGLFEEDVGAKLIGAVDVQFVGGVREDDLWDEPVLMVFSEPAQDIEAVLPWHFEIEKNQVWNGMIVVMGKSLAAHVFDELFAIGDDVKGTDLAASGDGDFEQLDIGVRVLR